MWLYLGRIAPTNFDLPHSTTIYTFISFLYTLVLNSEFLLFLPMILFILMLEKKMIASMGNGCGSCVEGKMAQDQLFMWIVDACLALYADCRCDFQIILRDSLLQLRWLRDSYATIALTLGPWLCVSPSWSQHWGHTVLVKILSSLIWDINYIAWFTPTDATCTLEVIALEVADKIFSPLPKFLLFRVQICN